MMENNQENQKESKDIIKTKRKFKKKSFFVVFVIILVIMLGVALVINRQIEIKKEQELILKEKQRQEKLLEEIKNSYNKYVKTNKEATLYVLENDKYNESGLVGKDIELILKDMDLTYETEYFYIEGIKRYISYKDVEKIEKLTEKDKVYKKYVVFNENVVTEKQTSFYNESGLAYKINEGVNLPIIIKDTDKYYVEYNDELLYVKKADVSIKKTNNTKAEIRNNIRTLTYHTIYDIKNEKCTNTVICHPIEQFDSHMKYLSENDYFTLRMEDLELFMDGKIRIPKKSIVITLDDGKYAKNAVDIVEKYKVYATYFIITKRYDVSKIKTTYMNFESHTHNLHNNWKCPGGNQGGQLLCEEEGKLLEDLKTSQEKLGGATAFAYPFFDFNDRAIKLLKEAGFTMAFIGQYDTDGFSTQKTNKMLLRRKTIFSTDSIDTFISYLN